MAVCETASFFAKMSVGWKEWTYKRHPRRQGKAEVNDIRWRGYAHF